jgi:hypothetical protein
MELEGSLPYSQVPATCPYPEPTLSSPHAPLQPPEDPSSSRLYFYKNFNIYLMFCWPCIIVYQYSETNVMHFLFDLVRIKDLLHVSSINCSSPGGV